MGQFLDMNLLYWNIVDTGSYSYRLQISKRNQTICWHGDQTIPVNLPETFPSLACLAWYSETVLEKSWHGIATMVGNEDVLQGQPTWRHQMQLGRKSGTCCAIPVCVQRNPKCSTARMVILVMLHKIASLQYSRTLQYISCWKLSDTFMRPFHHSLLHARLD